MKLDVFGKELEVKRSGNRWDVFYLGAEGKRRKAHDIVIPDTIEETQLVEYIADLCHEWSRPKYDTVKLIKK